MINDEEVKKYIKSEEEVKRFIAEQYELEKIPSPKPGDEYPFYFLALKDFLGKDLIKATEQPQHKYMLEDDMYYERVYTYYPTLWREFCRYNENRIKMDSGDRMVSERIAFISQSPSYHVRWLSFLHDNHMTKQDFYNNFGRTVNRHYYTYLMQLYHTQDNVPEAYGEVDILSKMQYQNRIKYMALELMRELYINSLDMSCAGEPPLPL